MTIFGQFFAYFSVSRINFENPFGEAIIITINSISLQIGAYLEICVLFRRVAIDFCSSSPSIMGPSVVAFLWGCNENYLACIKSSKNILGGRLDNRRTNSSTQSFMAREFKRFVLLNAYSPHG